MDTLDLKKIQDEIKQEIEEKNDQLDAIELLIALKHVQSQENYSQGWLCLFNNHNVFDYFESLIPQNKRINSISNGGRINIDGSKTNHDFSYYYFMIDDNNLMQAMICKTSKEGEKDTYHGNICTYRRSRKISVKTDPNVTYGAFNVGIYDDGRGRYKDVPLFNAHFSPEYNKYRNQDLTEVIGIVDLDDIIMSIIEKYHLEERVNKR